METIDELAARWVVRVDAGDLSADEQREFDAWLRADSRHLGAYVRARAQWIDLDRLAALYGRGHAQPHSPSCEPQRMTPAVPRRRLLAAAVAGMGILVGTLSWTMLHRDRQDISSGIGEVRRIALADGSSVVLNTNSEVIVELTTQRRNIRLVRGEALFEVAHDKSRPFIVEAHDTGVRAVGTAFSVRLEGTQVDVTVTEGVVEVAELKSLSGAVSRSASTAPVDGIRRVAAHERAIIASAAPPVVQPVAPAEAQRRLAWKDGMVSFEGESLRTAVSEINRHNRRQIVIDDPSLASVPVVGVFRTTDIDGFIAAAAAALNARATVDGDLIRLQYASHPE
ncbi:MAG TPA: FecR domain-containing protein [Steroidobacteraceae bacterium]|nr:FecR domain-containing protein [Steroidobacteraceae bacterium]